MLVADLIFIRNSSRNQKMQGWVDKALANIYSSHTRNDSITDWPSMCMTKYVHEQEPQYRVLASKFLKGVGSHTLISDKVRV